MFPRRKLRFAIICGVVLIVILSLLNSVNVPFRTEPLYYKIGVDRVLAESDDWACGVYTCTYVGAEITNTIIFNEETEAFEATLTIDSYNNYGDVEYLYKNRQVLIDRVGETQVICSVNELEDCNLDEAQLLQLEQIIDIVHEYILED